MQYVRVDVSCERHIIIVLNRPEQRNALHGSANRELGTIFDSFESEPELWIAILTGVGDKASS